MVKRRYWLSFRRLKAGLTQKEMADKLGMCRSAWNKIENGETMPTLPTAYKASKILNFPIRLFIEGVDYHETKEV